MDVDVLVPVWAALLVLHPHDVQRLVDDGASSGASPQPPPAVTVVIPSRQVDLMRSPGLQQAGPVVAEVGEAA